MYRKGERCVYVDGVHYQQSNGVPNADSNSTLQIGNHSNLLLCAINPHTDRGRRGNKKINRLIIINNFKKKNINNVKLAPSEYYKKLSDYKFIISPEGKWY